LGVKYDPARSEQLDLWVDIMRSAGWWWPYENFVVCSERPSVVHVEVNPGLSYPYGVPAHRLHSEHGPALAFCDGWAVSSWHGRRIPATPDEVRTWEAARILQEPNTETRRALIEILGWPQFIEAAKFKQVGKTCPDPGNDGQVLALYDVPEQIYNAPVRVLVCTNGTPERDETGGISRHTFGLTVPATIDDPLDAAAWTYGVPVAAYRQLEVRR
ncbi:MAG TPA: hypothetical protein VGL75_09345, partial [Acidothermaceae bacterium]